MAQWKPDWQDRAVTWTLQRTGQQFRALRNPTDSDDSAPVNVTQRQTQDGMLTYVWGVSPELVPLSFFTQEEGIAPWVAFRDAFKGQRAVYFSALDNVIKPVVVTDVRWTGSGQNPASFKVFVVQQEAEAFTL